MIYFDFTVSGMITFVQEGDVLGFWNFGSFSGLYGWSKAACKISETLGQTSRRNNFHWSWWGSSLPDLCMLDTPLSPPSTPAEIFSAHVWGWGTINQSSCYFRQFFALLGFPPKNFKKSLNQFSSHPKSYFVCKLKPNAKF